MQEANELLSVISQQAGRATKGALQLHKGQVESWNSNGTIMARLQPDDILVGPLRWMTMWGDNGWGAVGAPIKGTNILILDMAGDMSDLRAMGCDEAPPTLNAGEWGAFHKDGACVKLTNSNTVELGNVGLGADDSLARKSDLDALVTKINTMIVFITTLGYAGGPATTPACCSRTRGA